MNWNIVTRDMESVNPRTNELLDEAISAAPAGFVVTDESGKSTTEDTVAMLPRKPTHGRCRLCGKDADLTKEHIPPKSSGNKERLTNLTFDDWLRDRMNVNSKTKHTVDQGGIFGYTLCRNCNSLTGQLYGNEYKDWVQRTKKIIDGFGVGIVPQLNKTLGPFGENITIGSKEDGAVKPGAFVRQVLSCMCSLSGSWDLAGRYPEIRRIILEQSEEPLPTGIEMGMFIYFGPRIRIHGPQMRIDLKNEVWRWCQEIAFPPFAFQLIISSNIKDSGLGLLIDNFTKVAPNLEQYFSGIVEMGFGWTPYIGDYRSEAAIIASRASRVK